MIQLQPNQGGGKTIEKPLKELPWNQQYPSPSQIKKIFLNKF